MRNDRADAEVGVGRHLLAYEMARGVTVND